MEIVPGAKPGFQRVFGDVALEILELVRTADEMVEAFYLPKPSRASQSFVERDACELLP